MEEEFLDLEMLDELIICRGELKIKIMSFCSERWVRSGKEQFWIRVMSV